MRTRNQTLLGIDLHDTEIRAIQVRNVGGRAQVLQAGHAPTPAGSIAYGKIVEPRTLGLAVRRLIESIGAEEAGRVVFGIGGAGTAVRAVSLPPSPERELPNLVAGEVEYQQMVPDGGAYGFLRLEAEGSPEDGGCQVVVFTADPDAVAALRETALTAGLEVAAIEPTAFASWRALAAQLDARASTLMLALRQTGADLMFIHQGRAVFVRRIDVGSNALTEEIAALARVGVGAPVLTPSRYSDTPKFDELAIEVQRSLEYLAREHAGFAEVDRLRLVLDDVTLDPLRTAIEGRLGVPVEVLDLAEVDGVTNPLTSSALAAPEAFRYATAYGLALFGSPAGKSVPSIDLFVQERSAIAVRETLRNFRGSIAASAAALALGAIGFVLYNTQINAAEAEATKTELRATSIQGQTSAVLEDQAREDKRYRLLAADGVPLAPIAVDLAKSLAPGVGLSTLSISADHRILIGGEATSEAAMLQTADGLKTSGLISGLAVSSFDRKDDPQVGKGLSFQLSAQTVPLDRILNAPIPQVKGVQASIQQVSSR